MFLALLASHSVSFNEKHTKGRGKRDQIRQIRKTGTTRVISMGSGCSHLWVEERDLL